jgi:predicted nucleic acid-binding protein
MLIADTSVWIEFLKKHEPYYTTLKARLETNQVFTLECIFGELLQGAASRRERDLIEAYWVNLPRVDETDLFIKAGRYAGEHKLFSRGIGLIDAVLFVASQRSAAPVWTLDTKLEKLLAEHPQELT